jgi:hypothetical protein
MLTDKLSAIGAIMTGFESDQSKPVVKVQPENLTDISCQVKSGWREALFSGADNHSLCRYYTYHLEGITKFSDTLFKKYDRESGEPAGDCQVMLLELTDHLFECYRDYLADRPIAALAYQARWRHRLNRKITAVTNALTTVDPRCKHWLNAFLEEVYHPYEDNRFTYTSLDYLDHLAGHLSLMGVEKPLSDRSVDTVFLALNFNHLGYYNYRLQRYQDEVAGRNCLEKLAYYEAELTRINAQPVQVRYIYDPDWPSLKMMLANFLREEVAFIKQGLPKKAPDVLSAMGKIPLNLSVAQLACLIRVLFEEGCFGELNLQDLFKFFAANFRTKRQPQISSHSLSKEYYGVEQVTAAMMRDKLTKMLYWLNRNFFPVLIAIGAIIGAC